MKVQLYLTAVKGDAAEIHNYKTEAEAKEAAWNFLKEGWQVVIVRKEKVS